MSENLQMCLGIASIVFAFLFGISLVMRQERQAAGMDEPTTEELIDILKACSEFTKPGSAWLGEEGIKTKAIIPRELPKPSIAETLSVVGVCAVAGVTLCTWVSLLVIAFAAALSLPCVIVYAIWCAVQKFLL